MTIKVGVVGAAGRMGSEVCRAVHGADDLELVAAIDPSRAGDPLRDVAGVDTDLVVAEQLDALLEAGAEVAVEFTGPRTVGDNLRWLLEHGVHAVVGATGLADEDLAACKELSASGEANLLIAPNFAIGAVLLMQFAQEAAKHLPHVEIIERHHDAKVDAPSGTALRTAELIAEARREVPDAPGGDERHPGARGATHADVRVHSLRLPGIVADQDVVFGGLGQTLTISHRSLDRSSFMPGVLLACREVHGIHGCIVGLEHLL
ncbi:4-hydroxy-tetrahydrodipicolinate reductase [Nitriliruptor alkaliphilus]|uniref:4-hydroxy-tetrahydrodipicolinate reductase n=1 Tax=Nitriliruptor alkaliphilus TaxID=427918 RepID=UPI0006979291|nr:4-hydroxy-tetrahydrodipicolinate reductase [Nitriliruptor alkaliphilus]